jgi:hypothetical protein
MPKQYSNYDSLGLAFISSRSLRLPPSSFFFFRALEGEKMNLIKIYEHYNAQFFISREWNFYSSCRAGSFFFVFAVETDGLRTNRKTFDRPRLITQREVLAQIHSRILIELHCSRRYSPDITIMMSYGDFMRFKVETKLITARKL